MQVTIPTSLYFSSLSDVIDRRIRQIKRNRTEFAKFERNWWATNDWTDVHPVYPDWSMSSSLFENACTNMQEEFEYQLRYLDDLKKWMGVHYDPSYVHDKSDASNPFKDYFFNEEGAITWDTDSWGKTESVGSTYWDTINIKSVLDDLTDFSNGLNVYKFNLIYTNIGKNTVRPDAETTTALVLLELLERLKAHLAWSVEFVNK